MPTADLVVVGGGIVGAATAFYAARAGLDVVLVERRPGLATLTTTRSLEGFRAQFEDADDIAMMRESIQIFEHFSAILGIECDISLHQQGYLFVSQDENGLELVQARVSKQRAAGLSDVELLSGMEARRRFPFLAPDVTAAAFRQSDGWLASHEATYGFAEASRARIVDETEVVGFDVRGDRLVAVETSRGRFETPRAVICAGPFSGAVAALAGISLPFYALRRHRAGIKADERIPRGAPMTVSLDTGAHWRPEPPGAFLGYSAALEEVAAAPVEDVPFDPFFAAIALDAVSRLAPFWEDVARTLKRANVTIGAGQYEMTPDARPLIGPCGPEGLFVNTGYSGHGVMGSPAGARRLVDVMLGRIQDAANPYTPARFAGRAWAPGKLPL